MVVNRSGEISHKQFTDLEQLIHVGDTIVLNTTRGVRARVTLSELTARRSRTSVD